MVRAATASNLVKETTELSNSLAQSSQKLATVNTLGASADRIRVRLPAHTRGDISLTLKSAFRLNLGELLLTLDTQGIAREILGLRLVAEVLHTLFNKRSVVSGALGRAT